MNVREDHGRIYMDIQETIAFRQKMPFTLKLHLYYTLAKICRSYGIKVLEPGCHCNQISKAIGQKCICNLFSTEGMLDIKFGWGIPPGCRNISSILSTTEFLYPKSAAAVFRLGELKYNNFFILNDFLGVMQVSIILPRYIILLLPEAYTNTVQELHKVVIWEEVSTLLLLSFFRIVYYEGNYYQDDMTFPDPILSVSYPQTDKDLVYPIGSQELGQCIKWKCWILMTKNIFDAIKILNGQVRMSALSCYKTCTNAKYSSISDGGQGA